MRTIIPAQNTGSPTRLEFLLFGVSSGTLLPSMIWCGSSLYYAARTCEDIKLL